MVESTESSSFENHKKGENPINISEDHTRKHQCAHFQTLMWWWRVVNWTHAGSASSSCWWTMPASLAFWPFRKFDKRKNHTFIPSKAKWIVHCDPQQPFAKTNELQNDPICQFTPGNFNSKARSMSPTQAKKSLWSFAMLWEEQGSNQHKDLPHLPNFHPMRKMPVDAWESTGDCVWLSSQFAFDQMWVTKIWNEMKQRMSKHLLWTH